MDYLTYPFQCLYDWYYYPSLQPISFIDPDTIQSLKQNLENTTSIHDELLNYFHNRTKKGNLSSQ